MTKKIRKKAKKTGRSKKSVTALKRAGVTEIELKSILGPEIMEALLKKAKTNAEYKEVMRFWKKTLTEAKALQKRDLGKYRKRLDAEAEKICRPQFSGDNFSDREFRYLVSILCSKQEIAGFFQIETVTLDRFVQEKYGKTWEEVVRLFSGGARVAIRRAQMEAAMKGNSAMLKFLGKNMLGQSETVDLSHSTTAATWSELVGKFTDDNDSKTTEIHPEKSDDLDS